MRIVIDTNVLVSALLTPGAPPAALIACWRQGHFTVLSAPAQLQEFTRVTRYPKIKERISPPRAGRLVNELKGLAEMVHDLPLVDASPDPFDNYLLSIAQGGKASHLVTGDKRDLLSLGRHGPTVIVGVSAFLDMLRKQA